VSLNGYGVMIVQSAQWQGYRPDSNGILSWFPAGTRDFSPFQCPASV